MQSDDSEEHSPNSPIWEVAITGIEVFYSGETAESPLSQALIVPSPLGGDDWFTITCVSIPDTTESWPQYSTANIKHMIENPLVSSTTHSSPRVSGRRSRDAKVEKALVHSVRVKYNERHMFLDRDDSSWHSITGETLVLSTADILAILSST
jgi:hypothetical protein